MPFPRKSDDGVAFEMSASAPASQTSVSWPSEKARGQVPMPMRWSSEPKKRERKHNVEAALVALVVGRLAYETVRWFLERRRKRRRGGGGGAAPAA